MDETACSKESSAATPMALQQSFWNDWNVTHRQSGVSDISGDQRRVVLEWLGSLNRIDLDLIEVGCGNAWLCPSLQKFGRLTATDLSDEVLARARERIPGVEFIAGDFMELDLGRERFDVLVSLEVLSHVADQPAFIAKLAHLLRPGGLLMMATQNRPVLQRFNRVPPQAPGQLRHWVDRDELHNLLAPHFEVLELFSITPRANRGIMRFISSDKVNRIIRLFAGRSFDRLKEKLWLGWTLMALAKKRPPA